MSTKYFDKVNNLQINSEAGGQSLEVALQFHFHQCIVVCLYFFLFHLCSKFLVVFQMS